MFDVYFSFQTGETLARLVGGGEEGGGGEGGSGWGRTSGGGKKVSVAEHKTSDYYWTVHTSGGSHWWSVAAGRSQEDEIRFEEKMLKLKC